MSGAKRTSWRRGIDLTFDRKIPRRDDGRCWEWIGHTFANGYGVFSRMRPDGRRDYYLAHRVAYEYWVGPIPGDLTVDHLCKNRRCCNPKHMEIVTAGENARRGQGWVDGHCKRGHELTPATLYVAPGSGKHQCKECWPIRKQEARERRERGEAA